MHGLHGLISRQWPETDMTGRAEMYFKLALLGSGTPTKDHPFKSKPVS